MIVKATEADFLAFYHREAPPIWLGYCNKEGERITGFGAIVWNEWGCACAYFDKRAPISAFAMHRAVVKVLRALKEVGEPHVSATCDERFPQAAAWLRRLGFRPLEDNPEVWQVKL